jgi:hypothetical protein
MRKRIAAQEDEDVKRVATEYANTINNNNKLCNETLVKFFKKNYNHRLPEEVELVFAICPLKRQELEKSLNRRLQINTQQQNVETVDAVETVETVENVVSDVSNLEDILEEFRLTTGFKINGKISKRNTKSKCEPVRLTEKQLIVYSESRKKKISIDISMPESEPEKWEEYVFEETYNYQD